MFLIIFGGGEMKKALIILLSFALVFSVVGCSNSTAKTSSAGSKKQSNIIAVCLPTLDNPLMTGISDSIKKTFAGKNVQVSSANNDPNTQSTQVQNYITMNADLILVMPCDSSSLTPVLKKAVDAGIKIFVTGTTIPDASAYTAMASVNQYLVGEYNSLLAKQWVDKNYPNAANGSLEAAILTSSINQDSIDKSNGMLQITEQYMKNVKGQYIDEKNNVVDESKKIANPLYCPQIKVVKKVDAEMMQASQTAMQNILTTNPNVKVVLCCTSDGGSGVSQVYMDSKKSAEELLKIGVFGCGVIGPEEGLLTDSAKGKGVFRGADQFGAADVGAEMANIAKAILNNDKFDKDTWDPITLYYVKNGMLQKTPVNNTGAVKSVDCY